MLMEWTVRVFIELNSQSIFQPYHGDFWFFKQIDPSLHILTSTIIIHTNHNTFLQMSGPVGFPRSRPRSAHRQRSALARRPGRGSAGRSSKVSSVLSYAATVFRDFPFKIGSDLIGFGWWKCLFLFKMTPYLSETVFLSLIIISRDLGIFKVPLDSKPEGIFKKHR